MAQYRISTPQGNVLVEAPEGASREDVIGIYNRTLEYDKGSDARQAQASDRAYNTALREQAVATARSREPGVLDYFGEVPKGVIGGAAGLLESGALGLAALLPEGAENVVRDGIQSVGGAVQDYVSPDINLGDSIPRKFSEAAGSMAGLVGVSLINPIAGATTAVAAGAGEASERARAAGATQEERNLAALLGVVPGALDLLPVGRLVKGIKQVYKGEANPVELVTNRIVRAVREGGVEAGQEVASGIAQNMIEQGYNPEQGTFEGSGEAAGYGGAVGALTQALIDLATPRTRGGGATEPLQITDQREGQGQQAMLPAPEGIAGLLTDRRESDAREAIGSAIEARGDISLNEMQEIVARTQIPLPALERVVAEEREKRGSALAQRARADMEAGPEAPVEGAPSRMATAVADARAGRSAVQSDVARNEQNAQAAAREREGLRAAGRGDEAAFEQPDLFALQQEQERRRLGPEELRRPDQFMDELLYEQPETRTPERPAAMGDLVDMADQRQRAAQEDADLVDQLTAIEAEEAAQRQQAETLRAESAAETAQGRLDTDRAAKTAQIRTQVLQDTVANAGEIKQPAALRNAFESALAKAGLREPKATPQEMESLRRASSVMRAKDPALETVAEQEAVKDPGQLELEAMVAPKTRATPTPAGITPLNTAVVPSVDLGKTLEVSNVPRQETEPRTGGSGVPTPSGDVGAGRTGKVPSPTPTDKTARKPTTPRGGGLGSSVVEPRLPDAASRAERDALTEKGTTRKVMPTFPEKTTITKPSGGVRFPATKASQPLRKDTATTKVVDKETAAKNVRSELKKRWEAQASDVAKRDYAGTENQVKGDPFTTAENRKILNLLETPVKSREKDTLDAAVTYLGLYPNPAEGLYLAMQDVAMGTPQSRGDPLLRGTGGKAANKAVKWAEENLDSNGKEWLRKSTIAIQKDIMSVADANLTVAQLKEQGVTDAVQMQREKDALDAQREEAEAILEAEAQKNESFDIERQLGFTSIKIGKLLEANSVVGLDLPLHPSVGASIKAGDLRGALLSLADTSPSAQVRNIAAKLADVVGDTKLVTKKNLKAADGRPVAGMFDPETNTITLDEGAGINAHTLIHEMTHAAASATLSNKAHPLTKQITKLFESVKDYLDTAYGAQNVDEFFSEAMSNPEFRAKLAKINVKGEPISALRRFLNSAGNFVRRLMGRPTTPLDAMETVDTFVDGLLAPAPKYRNSGQLLMSSTADGVKKVLDTLVNRTQKKFGTPEARKDFRRQFGDDSVEFLQSGVADNAKRLLLRLTGSQGLADIAKAAGLGDLGYKLDSIINRQRGDIRIANELIKREIDKVVSWVGSVSDAKKDTLDRLIYNDRYGATIYQVDPTLTAEQAAKRYAKDSDKMDVWKAQRADWNALGADGQRTYKVMRDTYRGQYEKMRAVIFGEIDELMKDNPEAATKLKNEVYGKLFEKGTLDVYFPLIREGQYKLTYAAKNPASEREAYIVEMFTTKRERDRAAAEVKADKNFTGVETFDGEMSASDFRNAPPASFVAQTLRTLSANGVDGDVQTQIMRLFVNALPETSFAKSLQKRKGTPGHMTDSVYAMKSKAYDLAGQTEKLKYAAILRSLEREIVKQTDPKDAAKAKSRVGKTAQAARASFEDVKAELLDRSKFAREGAERKGLEAYGRRLNQTAFIFTIGFNVSSALVNLSQVPLFVMPFLGGKYGYKATGVAVKEAGSIVASSGNSILSNYDIRDDGVLTVKKDLDVSAERRKELENLAPLASLAMKRGQLGQGYLAEALGLEESGRVSRSGKLGAIMDNISVLSAFAFNHGEQFNRQVTLVMSYKLAMQKLAKDNPNMTRTELMDKAAEQAILETQETNGGSFLETAPPIAREGIGRVAAMYKSYGMQMYYTMLKAAKTAFDSDKGKLFGPEGSPERKAAWKQLIGLHGTAVFFAGIQGVPLYGAVQLLADLFFLDDEEDDFDTIVRKYVGEGWYKGAITEFAGIDGAGRMALTGLLIQENRFNNDPSLEENLGYYLGGPALSVAKRLGRGVSDLASGETQRGIENLLPVGVANAYKATFGRYAEQGGAFTRRADPIYDDMTGGELIAQALGFPPTEYTFRQEQNQISKRIDIAVGKRRSDLHKQYYVAMRLGDFGKADEVFDSIMKFNDRHPEAAITPSSIERSMNQHAETSTQMYNGVTLSPLYRNTLEQLRSEYRQ